MTRRLKRHFGVSARHVSVRSKRPWYWQAGAAILLALLGYYTGYWQWGELSSKAAHYASENQQLQARVIQAERQLQVERAAQSNLEKELVKLQDESLRLKEDVVFYQNMLGEKNKKGK